MMSDKCPTYIQQGNVRVILTAHNRSQVPRAVQQLEGSANLTISEAIQRKGRLSREEKWH